MEAYAYSVQLKNKVEVWENNVLTYLYQPIIGPQATSLYLLLVQECTTYKELHNVVKFDEQRLMTLSGLTSKQLKTQLSTLVAIGLIKSFMNVQTNSELAVEVYAPAEPTDFFNHPTLNTVLVKKVGNEMYECLRYQFREEGSDHSSGNYREIKKDLSEIFDTRSLIQEEYIDLKSKVKKNNILVDDIQFDVIKETLSRKNINLDLRNQSIKAAIIDIYATYKFDTKELVIILEKTYSTCGSKATAEDVYKVMTDIYFKDNHDTKNMKKTFEQVEDTTSGLTQKINEFEALNAEDYASQLLEVARLDSRIQKIIATLRVDFKLRDSIINTLIDYSYLRNNKEIVANYLYKIAQTLVEVGLTSTKEVTEYLIVAHKKSAKKYSKPFNKKSAKLDNKKINPIYEQSQEIQDDESFLNDDISVDSILKDLS